MLKTAPDPVDVQDLQFKLWCRIKVFDNTENNFPKHCNLVAAASRFGLIFVGTNTTNIQAIQLKDVEKFDKSEGDKVEYSRRTLQLTACPTHLSVNCEHSILAIVIEKDNCPCALFYDVKSFWQQEIVKVGEIRLSPTPSVQVVEVGWNPALASVFTACKSDGTLGVYELKNSGIEFNELPAAAGVTCFCWSPKGKQIAVGSHDGKITQLKPDLKAVKVINAPPLKGPHSLQSLQWISNYQFIGVFQPVNSDAPSSFIVIDAPKTGEPTYVNYDDICYSNGNTRPMQFYMILIPSWNILMAACSNSMEVGILGLGGESWTQWIMGDSARAELPLSSNHQETLPIGLALDIGSTLSLPWGESVLPPAPMLLLFSHHGTLCCFNVINLKPNIPTVCSPPDNINDVSGLQHFTIEKLQQKSNEVNLPKEHNLATPATPKLSNVEIPKVTTVTSGLNITSSLPSLSQPFINNQAMTDSKPQSINIFGGQATLTPIVAPKIQEPKPVPIVPTVPVATSTSNICSSAISKGVPTTASDLSSGIKLSNLEPKVDLLKTEVSTIDLQAEEEAEEIFSQMVREECVFLEAELKAVLHQGRNLKLNLGSDEDKVKIVETTKSLDKFFSELVESCLTQGSEVHILKQNLLQSWAWYEEAKSRYLASEDPSMMVLLRAQPLDSASEKQLADIKHTNYYLESQISQAHVALDEQWENFQDYCKKTHKIQIPTMEMIFQTMVKQNAILRKQSYILKDIASRLKNSKRPSLGPPLLLSVNDLNDLPEELKQLKMNAEDICQIQYEHVRNRRKNFTKNKVENLRSFLRKREYSHVPVIRPQLTTSVIHASPVSRLKQLSLSSLKTRPEQIAKKLDFVQSTPKFEAVSSGMHYSTPIEGLQNFASKFETKHFSNIPEKSFAPLKSVIASSPNSAFVSITFGGSTSTSNTVSSTPKSSFVAPSGVVTKATSISGKTVSSQDQPVITISTNNSSKPFSFAGSLNLFQNQESASNILKANTNLGPSTTKVMSETVSPLSTPKSMSSFGNETAATAGDTKAADVKTTVSVFKPTSLVTPSFSAPIAGTNLTTKNSTTSGIFGTAQTTAPNSPFSFGSSASSNIFASATQNLSEASASLSTSKPFSFAQQTTTASDSNQLISKLGSNITASQPINLSTTTTTAATVIPQQSIFSGFGVPPSSVILTIPSVSSPSSSFMPTQTTTSSLLGSLTSISNTQRPVSGVSSTTSLQVPVSGVKPRLSISTTPPTASLPAVATTSSIPTNTATVTTTSVSATNSNSFFGLPLTTSKPSMFDPAKTTSSSILSSLATTTNKSATAEVSSSSIFGNVPTTSTTTFGVSSTPSSIFAVTPTTTTTSTTQSSIFASGISTNVLGTKTTSPQPSTTTFGIASTPSSIFAVTPTSTTTSTTQSSIFAPGISTNVLGTKTASPQPSLFGSVPSTTSGFGTAPTTTQTSIFGSTGFGNSFTSTTQSSVFGTSPAVSSDFGNVAKTTTQSIFGTPSSTTSSSLFGATPTSSLFGSVPTSSTAPAIFSSGSQNQSSIFGTAASSTTSQSSPFGLFGDASQKSSMFGTPTTTANQSSIFANSNQSTVFGNAPNTTSSGFGQNQTTNTFGQSAFGPSTFGSPSAFGTATGTTFGQSGGSIFGNPQSTTAGSVFGGATVTTGSTFPPSGNVFGTPTSSTQSPFATGNIFQSTTQPSSFTANANTGGSFGFGSLSVGTPAATTSSSVFGSGASANPFGGDGKSIFGNPPAASSNTTFGATTRSPFASPSQTFGSGFGNQSSFGQSSFASFGQAPSGPFSSSASSGGVGQAGFGTTSNFQKPGAFGSSPVFGGSPAFGSAPSFGSTPAFGGSPSFGETSKVFGAPNSGFGSTSNSGFGTIANQPTMGFGNLAQQAGNASANPAFSGNSSFSSWR